MNHKKIEKKWVKRWKEKKIFHAEPEKKKKYFGTIPYPYINSYLHLGFFYTSMRFEALARFKRMNGYSVLYPQAWHCTGSPIVNAAKRVENKEPIQWNILEKQGFTKKEIENFSDPEEWVKYFPKEARKDLEKMGYSIDWRREFFTTSLNPQYDKFVRWQFNTLKKKGYVIKGKFPVVWDPIEDCPVGDHARLEGEGETAQEYVLIKHKLDDGRWIVSATLRPDTIMGVTNLFVNPDSDLVETKVDDELWIISEKTAKELSYQDKKIEIKLEIKGEDIIGKKVKEFSGDTVLILPASFVDTSVGTGIVHSVPSDSADDLIALYDLQKNENELKVFDIDVEEVKKIKPIAVIEIPGYGKIPAAEIIERLGIKNQKESDKLKKAKEILYKDGFYKGKLNKLYSKKFSKDFSGKSVQEAKDKIKEELIKSNFGDRYYQLTGKVVARSLGECVVKIVDDQWFLDYGNEKWKEETHKCLDDMKLYPEKTRSQFNYVIDWLNKWACTRELGLGTRLPWDEKWLIESLSDSTIYMAYYTIAHKIKDINAEKLDDNFFNYVFLGKGNKKELKIDGKLADELKEEFEYWYPMDFRNTGKDLIQNHMTFSLFNHTAIFPKKHWPKAYGLNGHVMIDGDKMSKSKGNFITIRQAHDKFGADASRFTALSGGEGIDDANFDSELALSMPRKFETMLEFAEKNYGKGRKEKLSIDDWMESKINKIIKDSTRYYEKTLYRSALQSCYFEMHNALKWYMRRTLNKPNKEIISKFIETQALLISPITPFITEEIWERIGKKNLISESEWPGYDEKKIDEKKEVQEELIKDTIEDINSVLKLVDIKPNIINLYVAEKWKYQFYDSLKKLLNEERDFGKIMGKMMKEDKFKKHSKEASKLIRKALKNGIDNYLDRKEEFIALDQSSGFLEKEFSTKIHVIEAEKTKEMKAKQGLPGKPAILVE